MQPLGQIVLEMELFTEMMSEYESTWGEEKEQILLHDRIQLKQKSWSGTQNALAFN